MAEVGSGLSESEAKKRLAEHGTNEIAKLRGRPQLQILLEQFKSLPIGLLAASALLSVATGGVLDAAIMFGDFTATTAESDFSESCIGDYGSSPSHRGPSAQ